tara:strand:- start:93 stop:1049 length:957 start_codon:yes stop_codon:yes gene_type:complete
MTKTSHVNNKENLNPAQKEILDQLGLPKEKRPVFSEDIRSHLKDSLEKAVSKNLNTVNNDDIFLNKHRLNMTHGCEARFLAEDGGQFEWKVPLARGTIVHKAIELSLNWRKANEPSLLVDETLSIFEGDTSDFSHWLQSSSEASRAELRSESIDIVAKFLECWPTLKPAWKPVTESRIRSELCEGRLILIGRVDLTLGSAEGQRAGKVIIDFKTGGFSPTHLEDLRFYALIETLRIGTPPRLVVSYNLEQAKLISENINEDALMSATRRVVEGIERLTELLYKNKTPVKIPGPACRWCSISETCNEGKNYLLETDYSV